jgi:acetyltransferase-like isoleucine patch superfamily enzyme
VAEAFIHPSAFVEPEATIGAGSSIWHEAQVRNGAVVGEQCVVGKGVYIGAGVRVGDRCKIQNYALVFEGSTVEDGVFIGPGAQLANDRYPRAITPEGKLKSGADWELGSVYLEEGCSIGAGAIVVPNTRVGRWAMVGSGAVVTRDVAPHVLVTGNPARVIGYMCMCGRRLVPFEGQWRCGSCDRSYLLPALEIQ